MPIHAHRLVVEIHIQVSAKHQQKADSIDITEMHAPKHANQRKGQPQQATRNGPTGDRGTLQIANVLLLTNISSRKMPMLYHV